MIAPADATRGPVPVVVTNNGVASASLTAQLQATSPAFFTVSSKYPVATHADGSLVGPATLFPGASTPARPGETIVLYGTGFGPTSPSFEGTLVTSPAPVTNPPQITIAGQPVSPMFVGLVAPGLYQINLTIPATTGTTGAVDVPISATNGGATTQPNLFLAVLPGQQGQ